MHFSKTIILAVITSGVLCIPLEGLTLERSMEAKKKKPHPPIPPPPANPEISDWRDRPWSHYDMKATVADKIYPVDIAKVEIDHTDIVTPSLPSDIKIPRPFLPTKDKKVKDLYWKSLAAYLSEKGKTQEQKSKELSQKWADVKDFNDKTLCYYSTSSIHLRCANKQDEMERRFNIIKFRNKYHRITNKLIDEMRVEGLVNLGRELMEYMKKTGQTVDENQ
ncbi:hypothetical protein QTJ16_002541 [Diplocarpon rosae]|uniref:Uncharacterized protein n=1 Tax=Diplocarpon rosae TaxID=946125 RepID=A0AAD9T200_9HELO|nr:hypothetical protein QTJ16_002541 [Diplocarpon rosae]